MNRSKYLKSAKENRPLPVKITPNPQRNRLIYKTIATNTDDEEIHLYPRHPVTKLIRWLKTKLFQPLKQKLQRLVTKK